MQRKSLSRNWRFHLNDISGPRWSIPDSIDWRILDIPHDWSIEQTRSSENVSSDSGGFFPMGQGWYHKIVRADKTWQDKKIFIEFEGVYMNAEVWLNHHFLGRHPYGYTSFHYDLSPYIDWEGTNTVRVFVDNSHQLNSRWYSGSGIYRPVWLLIADPIHISHWGTCITTSDISTESALVNIQILIENESGSEENISLDTRILAPDGKDVGILKNEHLIEEGACYEFSVEIPITNPQLWSPDHPCLYNFEAKVIVNGQVVDIENSTFGIRSLKFSAENGFLLNGEPVLLKGGCVHHDNGILGAASYLRSEERKVEMLKANGFNAIRCAHNPPAPSFLDACDRLGMFVIDEAFDCWRDGKNHGDYHVVFDDWWKRDLESMLLRDRNHPSIIMWSIGNEVIERDGYGEGYKISQIMADHVRKVDPTRPVTAAICSSWRGDSWDIMDPAFATLDVGGYNYEWEQYRPDHDRKPNRIIVGSESFALEAFENWQVVEEMPAVIGDFVWTSLDYLGEAGIGREFFDKPNNNFLGGYPWHHANCGDLDLCGFKRPQSFYRDMLWRDYPAIYIAVQPPYSDDSLPEMTGWGWPDVWPDWNWSGYEGEPFQVVVYSNCDEVELFLDDQSFGRKPCSKNEKYRAGFEVIYKPGRLRGIGYSDNKIVCEYEIGTTGKAAQICLSADREVICANGLDLCYVTVEVMDEQSSLIPTAENQMDFSITGPGKILAVGNGNPMSEELYIGNQRKVFRGRALVVVKSTNEPGKIIFAAQSEGLQRVEKVINSNQ